MSFWLWLHLVSAAVWLGGLITVAALVPALRQAGVTTEQLRAMARRFGQVAWVAIGTAIVSGAVLLWQRRALLGSPDFAGRLFAKMVLVLVAVALAYWHQVAAREQSPRVRGVVQGLILLSGLFIFAVAIGL